MDKNLIVLMDLGKGVFNAYGWRKGVPLASAVLHGKGMSRGEVERAVRDRFHSQFHNDKANAKLVDRKRLNWEIRWIDPKEAAELGRAERPVQEPLMDIAPKRKPKIYEVLDDGKGLRLIRHDAELLDEDEAKLKLFEMAVNG